MQVIRGHLVIASFLFLVIFTSVAAQQPEKFIRLLEFQVWADWRGPEVGRLLSNLYNETGRSHVFTLKNDELFVWDRNRMRGWVDETVKLGCFNLFTLGDDVRTADGYLFTNDGLNPAFKDFYFETVAYAHKRGLMVGVEPRALPKPLSREKVVQWARTFLDPSLGSEKLTDVIKMSIEWLDAYKHNPAIAEETEAFVEGVRAVNPDVVIYLDSIGGRWRQPRAYHYWIMERYPKMMISHYLNSDQVPLFRKAGASNIMVQINPQEFKPEGGQFFVFHDRTVEILKDVVRQRVHLLSLAGVNHGYNRDNYDLFLDILRPHLNLVHDLNELKSILKDSKPAKKVTKADVRAEESAQQTKEDE